MCEGKRTCQKPKKLIGKPEDCSSEQIKKCHGTDKKHPCTSSYNKQKGERLL